MKTVIIWGGLRGSVTLALALAVTENAFVEPQVQRFIAIQATGFALFTLLAFDLWCDATFGEGARIPLGDAEETTS